MAQQQTNPLLAPPFFLIEGINPSSPLSVQMEQIDQLNTLLLQEIDENFAKFHQTVTSKILPEIKRFAIAGEPTREAAQFWRSFYEAAAAVRGTAAGETTLDEQEADRSTYEDETVTLNRDESGSFSSAHQDGSFVFGNGATASTPLRNRQHDNSWESSMDSPYEKTERLLRNMRIGDEGDSYGSGSDVPTPSLPTGYALSDVARDSLASGSGSRGGDDSSILDPPSPSSTPRAAARNGQTHITDLRSTPLNAKFPRSAKKNSAYKPYFQGSKPAARASAADDDDSDDEDMFMGMSPPRTMNFGTLPSRAQAIQAAASGKTPRKDSDARAIVNDIMLEMDNYVPSPKMPTPDFLKRYSVLPPIPPSDTSSPSASTSRKLFQPDPTGGGLAAPPGPSGAAATRRSMANTSFGSDTVSQPTPNQVIGEDSFEHDSFSSDGSGTVPPPADYRSDLSYATNTPGPIGHHAGDFSTIMHPSRDLGDTEVFGPPGSSYSAGGAGGPFEIMRQSEIHTFHGGRLEDAAGQDVDYSPLKGLGGKKSTK